MDSNNCGLKIFGKKNNSRKFQKAKPEYAGLQTTIYIVLSIKRNLEMILKSRWKDLHRLYANTT